MRAIVELEIPGGGTIGIELVTLATYRVETGVSPSELAALGYLHKSKAPVWRGRIDERSALRPPRASVVRTSIRPTSNLFRQAVCVCDDVRGGVGYEQATAIKIGLGVLVGIGFGAAVYSYVCRPAASKQR